MADDKGKRKFLELPYGLKTEKLHICLRLLEHEKNKKPLGI